MEDEGYHEALSDYVFKLNKIVKAFATKETRKKLWSS